MGDHVLQHKRTELLLEVSHLMSFKDADCDFVQRSQVSVFKYDIVVLADHEGDHELHEPGLEELNQVLVHIAEQRYQAVDVYVFQLMEEVILNYGNRIHNLWLDVCDLEIPDVVFRIFVSFEFQRVADKWEALEEIELVLDEAEALLEVLLEHHLSERVVLRLIADQQVGILERSQELINHFLELARGDDFEAQNFLLVFAGDRTQHHFLGSFVLVLGASVPLLDVFHFREVPFQLGAVSEDVVALRRLKEGNALCVNVLVRNFLDLDFQLLVLLADDFRHDVIADCCVFDGKILILQ